MNAASIIADRLVAHHVDLSGVAKSYADSAVSMLRDLEKDIVGEIETSDPVTQKAMAGLLDSVQKTIDSAYRSEIKTQKAALVEIAEMQAEVGAKAIADIGIPIEAVGLTDAKLKAMVDGPTVMGAPAASWWQGQSVDLSRRFAATMRLGFAANETVERLVARVRGTKRQGYSDGVMSISKAHATALVRTSVQSLANAARLASFEEYEDIAGELVWVATLDGRTSNVCKSLSGLRWSLKTRKPIGHSKSFLVPPAHWQCRSVLSLIPREFSALPTATREAFEAALKKQGFTKAQISKAMAGARASMDGQVPADLSMEAWLKTKTPEFLERAFGKGAYELWKSGKISLQDLSDNQSRPLTLEQLRARAGIGGRSEKLPPVKSIKAEIDEAKQRGNRNLKAAIEALEGIVPDAVLLEAAKSAARIMRAIEEK